MSNHDEPNEQACQSVIWREAERIRAADGRGFSDRVSDKDLGGYAADLAASEYDRTFAAAVLAIRRFERAALVRSHARRENCNA